MANDKVKRAVEGDVHVAANAGDAIQAHRDRRQRRRLEVVARQANAAEDDFLHIASVEARVGLSRSKIYQLIREGKFPAPSKFGSRCSRWRAGGIKCWLQRQHA